MKVLIIYKIKQRFLFFFFLKKKTILTKKKIQVILEPMFYATVLSGLN